MLKWSICQKTCAKVVRNAKSDRFGGRQCFFPSSWQQTFGKQSSVLLHGFGCKSYASGGAGVHCIYSANASIATTKINQYCLSIVMVVWWPLWSLVEIIENNDLRYANRLPTGSVSNSGLDVLQYLFNPSGQQIRGQQSWSVLQVFNSQNSSANGSFGHFRGIKPRIATVQNKKSLNLIWKHDEKGTN